MSKLHRTILSCVLVLTACKGKDTEASDPGATATAPAAKPAGCSFLDEAKVKAITGVVVTTHPHGNPQSCALFQTAQGDDYLLVATGSAGSYGTFVESNPPKMFPLRTPVPGVGKEAILMRWSDDPASSRVLIARNDDRTVVLVPMPAPNTPPITDAQLTEIARASVATP